MQNLFKYYLTSKSNLHFEKHMQHFPIVIVMSAIYPIMILNDLSWIIYEYFIFLWCFILYIFKSKLKIKVIVKMFSFNEILHQNQQMHVSEKRIYGTKQLIQQKSDKLLSFNLVLHKCTNPLSNSTSKIKYIKHI